MTGWLVTGADGLLEEQPGADGMLEEQPGAAPVYHVT